MNTRRLNYSAGDGIVIYAPYGAGLPLHAHALATGFGKTRIVDDWTPGGPVRADTLAITNVPVHGAVYALDALDATDIKIPPAYRKALVAARGAA